MSATESMILAVKAYGDECYRAGLNAGIVEMEKFIGWMTMQPDTKRQRQQREWMQKRVDELRQCVGVTSP